MSKLNIQYIKLLTQYLIIIFLIITILTNPIKVFAQVIINEFQVAPSSAQWVELYNKSDQTVDISAWIIDDDGGTQKYIIDNGITLSSHKCISFQSGNFNFNTTSSDSAKLIRNSEIIDSYSYSASPGENVSFGRSSDGGDTWITFSNPSRDKLNSSGELCLAPTPTPTLTPVPTSLPTEGPSLTPTPTSTSSSNTPTVKPKATATKYLQYTITPKLTNTAESTSATEAIEEVLGESTDETSGKKFSKVLMIVLLVLGVGCIGAAVILSFRQLRVKRRGY